LKSVTEAVNSGALGTTMSPTTEEVGDDILDNAGGALASDNYFFSC